MAGRRLSPEEREIWAKVTATVRPMAGRQAARKLLEETVATVAVPKAPMLKPVTMIKRPVALSRTQTVQQPKPAAPVSKDHLDGSWDKKLQKGAVVPDHIVDLHGHTLASAHVALDQALDRAIRDEARVILLVTGKPPKGTPPHGRGLIRNSIGDWLALSRHASRIAAVRNAHPRHGGAGALYLIMRRARTG